MNRLNAAAGAPGVAAAFANVDSSSVRSNSESSLLSLQEERQSSHHSTSTDTSTTDEEESDTHSVHSRRDSMEGNVKAHELVAGNGGGGGAGRGKDRRGMSGESAGHKRNLDGTQGTLLRKACDLCTKVCLFPGLE